MPRKPRFYQADIPAHVYQRGHNKSPVFFDVYDYLEFLRILKKTADALSCAVHAYVLMTNHVHFLLTPSDEKGISLLFQSLGREYVRYINQRYGRCGSLWQGRHKGNVINSSEYFLLCMQYIEMNPVRANMVDHPAKYRWSSFAANALGESNNIIRCHDEYLGLGNNMTSRRKIYRQQFEIPIDKNETQLIQQSLHSGTPVGNEKFQRYIERVTGNKVGTYKRGRPTVQAAT